jgi:hypothetical protein
MNILTRLLMVSLVSLTMIVPASAQKMSAADNTLNAGKVDWGQRRVELGEIPQGIPAIREFKIKNISKEPLVFADVRSGCHCTTVEWTTTPIPPGETGVVKATFDAVNEGDFYKIITVSTNFDPKQPMALTMVGTVKPKKP